jgi:hypothetical protein
LWWEVKMGVRGYVDDEISSEYDYESEKYFSEYAAKYYIT